MAPGGTYPWRRESPRGPFGCAWGGRCRLCPTVFQGPWLPMPVHHQMGDPDILAGPVEYLLHAGPAVWP